MEDVKLPLTNFVGESDLGRANRPVQKIKIFWARQKNVACPSDFEKIHCPCILEGHLLTNPILSALHLQGPKSNIYVHFH